MYTVFLAVILTLITVALPACLLPTILIWRKAFVLQMPYVVAVVTAVKAGVLINNTPHLINYLLIYYNLALIALYQNYRPLVLQGIFSLAITNYLWFTYKDTMFAPYGINDLGTLNIIIMLVTGILIGSARFGEKMRHDVEANAQAALQAKQENEILLQRIAESVQVLRDYTSQSRHDVTANGQTVAGITEETADSVGEVLTGTEEKTAASRTSSTPSNVWTTSPPNWPIWRSDNKPGNPTYVLGHGSGFLRCKGFS